MVCGRGLWGEAAQGGRDPAGPRNPAWFLDPVFRPTKKRARGLFVDLAIPASFQRARFKVTTVVCVGGNQSPKLCPFQAVRSLCVCARTHWQRPVWNQRWTTTLEQLPKK